MYWRCAPPNPAVPRTLPRNRRRLTTPCRRQSHTMHKVAKSHNSPANSTHPGEAACVTASHTRVVEALDDLENGGEVLVAQAAPRAGRVELPGEGRGGEGRARLAGLLKAQPHVLEHVLELEQRRDDVDVHCLATPPRPSSE